MNIDKEYIVEYLEKIGLDKKKIDDSTIYHVMEVMTKYDTKWWELDKKEASKHQIFEDVLLMNFGDFQAGLEAYLERPIYTHEFGFNVEGLREEVLGKH